MAPAIVNPSREAVSASESILPGKSTKESQSSKKTPTSAGLSDRMKKLLTDPLIPHDITFVFPEEKHGSDPFRVTAHKMILTSASSVFNAMFFGPLSEKDSVKILDSDSESFSEMISFIYTDQVDVKIENVGGLLYLAKKYDIFDLENRCLDFIRETLDRKNVLQFIKFLSILGDSDINKLAWKVLDANGHFIINNNDMVRQLDGDIFLEILKRDTFCCREVDVFDALIWWTKKTKKFETDDQRKEFLQPFLSYIRFPLMTLKEFIQIVVPSGFLTSEEIMNVLTTTHKRKTKAESLLTPLFSKKIRALGQNLTMSLKDMQGVTHDSVRGRAGLTTSWGSPVSASNFSPSAVLAKQGNLFENIAAPGHRSVQLKLMQRVFLKDVVIENVPHRVCLDHFVTAIRVTDLDLDEIVSHTDYALKRDEAMTPRPARFDLSLASPLELCPKVRYQIDISIEHSPGMEDQTDKTGMTSVQRAFKASSKEEQEVIPGFTPGISVHVSHFNPMILMEEEARVSELTFMF